MFSSNPPPASVRRVLSTVYGRMLATLSIVRGVRARLHRWQHNLHLNCVFVCVCQHAFGRCTERDPEACGVFYEQLHKNRCTDERVRARFNRSARTTREMKRSSARAAVLAVLWRDGEAISCKSWNCIRQRATHYTHTRHTPHGHANTFGAANSLATRAIWCAHTVG